MHAYKLLNPDLTSYGRCQWTVGEWKETSGKGNLCGRGWLHAYPSPTIAHFLNPIHADLTNPVCYLVEVEGGRRDDCGLKVGYTRMRLLTPSILPVPTTEQRVRFAIGCAAAITRSPSFVAWADAWLCGVDRSARSAEAAARSARSAEAAARSAWAAEAAEAAAAAAWAARSAWAAEAAEAAAAAWAARSAAEAAWAAKRSRGSLNLEAMAVWAMSNGVILPIQKGA